MGVTSIIVPVYNEEQNIRHFYNELIKYAPVEMELLWIDDGSTDNTFLEIEDICKQNVNLKCISFSRNFGHQNAILAGLQYATGNTFIIMDGDLQHPPAIIPEMLKKLEEGYNIVNSKRISTKKINFFKLIASNFYYWFLNMIAEIDVQKNNADFKAFDKKVYNAIMKFEEREQFIRGIFSWIGFKSTAIEFTALARDYGKTKYSLNKMIRFGITGITSFSLKPLKIAFLTGLILSFLALLFILYALYAHMTGRTISGWTSIIISVVFLGGVQLIFTGIIGIYVGQILVEAKKRPVYLVQNTIHI
ncbi:MAG: glycosyltransferase family 2 protein [Bacteroidota bacterium]